MSDRIIRSAFESRLAAWASARVPPLPVAYQNNVFEPPANSGSYLRAALLPSSTDSLDLAGEHRLYRGVFQIDVVVKAGGGTGLASGIVDELIALFPLNLGLAKSGLAVYVRSPMSEGPLLVDSLMTITPVSCAYRADTP